MVEGLLTKFADDYRQRSAVAKCLYGTHRTGGQTTKKIRSPIDIALKLGNIQAYMSEKSVGRLAGTR